MVWSENLPRRLYQMKHATKATKLQLLEHVSRTRGAGIVTVCGNFRLSESGARCKLWRLTKQGLIEPIPENVCREKVWQLTSAGRRHLEFLRTRQLRIGVTNGQRPDLEAEIARLRDERDRWRKVAADRAQQVALARGANQSLRRDLSQALAEKERLRAKLTGCQLALLSRR